MKAEDFKVDDFCCSEPFRADLMESGCEFTYVVIAEVHPSGQTWATEREANFALRVNFLDKIFTGKMEWGEAEEGLFEFDGSPEEVTALLDEAGIQHNPKMDEHAEYFKETYEVEF